MEIQLRPIDADNWHEAIGLQVLPEQTDFVASNLYSLAEAFVKPEWPEYRPLAIYQNGLMVGFTMYAGDPSSRDKHFIQRFMIDRKFQGRGYGRAAFGEILKLIRSNRNCEQITLSVNPANAGARQLYESFGFVDTGEMHFGEKVYTLRLNHTAD